jgi:hypothetical protein
MDSPTTKVLRSPDTISDDAITDGVPLVLPGDGVPLVLPGDGVPQAPHVYAETTTKAWDSAGVPLVTPPECEVVHGYCEMCGTPLGSEAHKYLCETREAHIYKGVIYPSVEAVKAAMAQEWTPTYVAGVPLIPQ